MRTMTFLVRVIHIIFGVPPHKRPGSESILAIFFKLDIVLLAPIIIEILEHLCDVCFRAGAMCDYLLVCLWLPIVQRRDACSINAVRDFEIPNETCDVLEIITPSHS